MNFKKYNHIENSYREKYIQGVKECLENLECTKMPFSVSEKVDGCNVSIITDGNEILTGKRSSLLSDDENFYGFQQFAEKLRGGVIGIFEYFKNEDKDVVCVQVFGEFFGGGYKDIKTTVTRIQKGIYYTPEHEFYAFDILVTFADGTTNYVDVDECNELFDKFGFFYNKELFRGSLDECLEYNPVFISTIGTRLGFPEIEGNYAEGVVIKPVVPIYFPNGERVIIKNKNPKFVEFEKKDKKPKEEISFTDDCNRCMSEIENYCTEARLGNVISHIGELDMPKQTGLLIKEYATDVIEDFTKDHPEYDMLSTFEQKAVNKVINKLTIELIKKKF